jgi:hypothetical protein
MGLMGLRDFAWDKGFSDLRINITLICLQLIGMYRKAKLGLSSTIGFRASSSKPCCSMSGIIPLMLGDLYG